MDIEDTPEIDIYEVPEGNAYASAPVPNNTLTMLVGANEGNYEDVHRSIATQGAAYVAAQRAIQERQEEVALWEGAARVKAQQGDVAAVEGAIKEIQSLRAPKVEQSYVDDVDTIARATIERLAASSGKSPEDIIRLARLRSRNLAVKSALEIAIQAMPERGMLAQLGQDVIGATTAEDWAVMAPTVHAFAKEYGLDAPRAFTKAGATENVLALLRQVSPEDAPKVVRHLADTLTQAVGGKDARRFFEQLNSLVVDDATTEALFGALDVATLGALAKGALKAVWRGSNVLRTARSVGKEEDAVNDLLSKLTSGKSALGASKEEALDASVASSTLSDLRTIAPQLHKELEERTEALLKNLNDTLYTGGATSDEVKATVSRLEAAFSRERNPAIVDAARIVGNTEKGTVQVDVLYGKHSGKLFDTAEEALDYWKTRKAGTLEAVQVGDSVENTKVAIAELEKEIAKLREDMVRPSTPVDILDYGNDVLMSRGGRANAGFNMVNNLKDVPRVTLKEMLSKINTGGIVDEMAKRLAKVAGDDLKVVSHPDVKRAFFNIPNSTVYVNASDDANVVFHEAMHAFTAHRIEFAKRNPTSELGKVYKRMDDLRYKVRIAADKNKKLSIGAKHYIDYLTSNLDEFSTSAFWQIGNMPEVAEFMNSIPYKNTTLLREMWENFKAILGFKTDDTALSEFFGLTEESLSKGLKVIHPETISEVNGRNVLTGRTMAGGVPREITYAGKDEASDALSERVAELISKKAELEEKGAQKWAVRQKVDYPVFTDDIGTLTVDELDQIHRGLGVANPRFLATRSLFQGAITSMYKKTRMRELYKGFIEESFDKLNKHSLEKVDDALVASDKLKRNLSAVELDAMGLGAAEQEAYYAYRTMRDIQWQIKNAEAVRDLVAKGNEFIKVTFDDITFEGPAKALNLDSFVGKRFYDVENKKFVTVTQENLQELKTRNVLAYEYAQGQSVAGVKSDITRVISPVNSTMRGDVRQAVGRVDGSFSRVYSEEYWIKLQGEGLVNDEATQISKAFRTAATEADAKAYVKGFEALKALRASKGALTADDVVKHLGGFEKDAKGLADAFNNGEFDRFTITQNYTRMEDNFIRDVVGTGGGDLTEGRVFWSKRGEEAIKSITEGGTAAQTLGPLKSLEAELSNTSNYASINEWRRNSIQRWYNTFANELNVRGISDKDAESAFFDSVNKLKGIMGGTEREKQMMATRDFILNQMGVLTTHEKHIRSFVQKLTAGIDGVLPTSKVPALAHVGHFLRKSNVAEWTKGVSSNLMLGMFNVGQLVVQSSGMALTVAMNPKHGLKAAMSIRPILVAMTSDNPSVWKKVFKAGNVAKDTGMTASEFQEVAQAIRKVGLLDNIGASSLYTAEDGALNIYGSKGLQKFNQKQMMFFNKGEEINRVGAFETARREWMELNPGKKWNTDGALAEIVARADDYSMNMTRVTEGMYQKGALGIPFQFLQHSIKFGANFVGGLLGKGSLSPREGIQLVMGSLVLFGMPAALEEKLGDYLNGLDEQTKVYITEGLLAGVVATVGETLTGERTNIALGSRLGNLDFYDNLFFGAIDLLSGETTKIGQAITGPTGSTIRNLTDAFEIVGDFWGQDEKSFSSFVSHFNQFGSTMVSSWRAAEKAYFAYHANGALYNRKGDPVATLTTPEWVFQAMSFQSIEAAEANALFKTRQDYEKFIKRVSDDYIRLRGQSFKAYLAGNKEDADTKMRQADALVFPLPEGDRQRIWRAVSERTTYGTVGEEAINKWGQGLTSHKNRLMVTNPYEDVNGKD